MIQLNGLTKRFDDLCVLDKVQLHIKKGEIFGIIGKSGAGKSTLLHCMNLLVRPDAGEVIVDNQDLLKLSSEALRQARHRIAMIFQHFNLLHSRTVYDNIALPLRIQGKSEGEIQTKVEELLALIELSHRKEDFPAQLSGGQKQRVAIARALSCSPQILLCDEATSALDPETTHAILNLLKTINQRFGITIVLITHEMDVIKRICHRVAVMEAGHVVETHSLATALESANSVARRLLFKEISPTLPDCLAQRLTSKLTHQPILRLSFQGPSATVPFISRTSRDLKLDINILLANLDRFDGITCGVLVVELEASPPLLQKFIERCEAGKLTVEILGYVDGTII